MMKKPKSKKAKQKKRETVNEYSIIHEDEGYLEEDFYEDELTDVDFNDLIMVNDEEYNKTILKLRNHILKNIRTEKDKKVRVLFPLEDDEDTYINVVMTQGKLLTLIILAEPFHVNNVLFTENFLFNVKDTSSINNYFDTIIKYFKENLNIDISKTLMNTISNLSIVSSKILGSTAVTINLFDLCHLMSTNKEFNELIRFKLRNVKKNIEFKEATNMINDKFRRVLDILIADNNCYSLLLKSKSGINERQLKDTIFIVGFKPDEKGYIIPEPADNSYIEGNDILGFYIDTVGARKALCINYKNTKSSGYLTRKLSLLCIDNFIDEDIIDCGTKHYVNKYIDSEKTLDRLIHRNYVVRTKSGKEIIKTINPDEDKHLIGKTIRLRSPITCACKNGKICRTCYGELWKYNYDKNVGLLAVLILTNQNTQLQLSAKHNLQASIDKINWGDEFLKYFTINKEQIFLNEEYVGTKINIGIPEFLETDEFDDKYIFNTLVVEEPKGETVTISLPKNLILNDDIIDFSYSSTKEMNVLQVKNLTDSDALFTYTMNNNELSASLNNIINLIESHNYIKSHTISEILDRFAYLLNDSPLIVHLIHIEIILKELSVVHNNDRSLFKIPVEDLVLDDLEVDDEFLDDYPIIDMRRVTDAIINSNSFAKSLVYQEQFRQFTRMPETYYKKEKSLIDKLF